MIVLQLVVVFLWCFCKRDVPVYLNAFGYTYTDAKKKVCILQMPIRHTSLNTRLCKIIRYAFYRGFYYDSKMDNYTNIN